MKRFCAFFFVRAYARRRDITISVLKMLNRETTAKHNAESAKLYLLSCMKKYRPSRVRAIAAELGLETVNV